MGSLMHYLGAGTYALKRGVKTYSLCNSCSNLVNYRFQPQGSYNYVSHLKTHCRQLPKEIRLG